ncbi:MAG: MnhB domain-containing protein [Actinomycetota bacterium]|nr:MnhB domain-containing protein [Actinomycetota bacterium]
MRNAPAKSPEVTSVMTRTVAKLLFLPTLVVAVAILAKGYAQPGDGFSAGVVCALGVLLQYLAFGRREAEKIPIVGLAGKSAFAGLLLALLVATAPVLLGEPVLTHYPRPGSEAVYLGTLELITALLFDVGVFLLVFGFVVGAIRIIARAIADEDEYRGPETVDTNIGANAEPSAGEEGG